MTDSQLLSRFAAHRDQGAFAELVRRNIDLVYGAALRHVNGDQHRAEDVAQQVFIDLAGKAQVLAGHPCLAGWLYASVRFTAVNSIRSEQRRSIREREVELMKISEDPAEPRWEQIRPVIDEAMEELGEEDRQSVLLRFFGRQTFGVIGQQLGLSENAAQKRVDRALDHLNVALTRRGLGSTAAVLSAALAHAGVTAPVGLVNSIAAASLVPGAATVAGKLGWWGVGKILAGTGVAVAFGFSAGVWHGGDAVKQGAERQQAELALKIDALGARLRSESKRTQTAEAETAMLLSEIEKARAARAAATATVKASSSAPIAASNGNGAASEHIVVPGDTGMRIATATGLSLGELQALNPDLNFARLRVGHPVRVK